MSFFIYNCLLNTVLIVYSAVAAGYEPTTAPTPTAPAWQGRSIGTSKLRLVEFSAFLEQQRDPESVSLFFVVFFGNAQLYIRHYSYFQLNAIFVLKAESCSHSF